MPLRLGVIGAGTMGSLHARVATDSPDLDLRWVTDPDAQARERVGSRYGVDTKVAPSSLDDVDAVIIATPTHVHTEWCLEAIDAGIPFLVEKPLSTDHQEVEEVAAAALVAGVAFTAGFVERYNPAVRTVEGIIGNPVYFNAVRHSPYVQRIRTGVGGDLMIHDIDLALLLMDSDPVSVVASLANVHPSSESDAEDIAEAHIRFADGGVASLSANRTAQRKIRMMTVANLEITAEVDLMRQDITLYRHVLSAAITEDRAGYHQETVMEIPQLRYRIEPLVAQMAHFVDLVVGDADPVREADGILKSHHVLAASRRSAVEGCAVTIADV